MNPQKFLEQTTKLAANLREAKDKAVFVGLPAEKVGGKIYGDGMTVLRVGAIHEYGAGVNPQRSFLRVPFAVSRTAINNGIAAQFARLAEGEKVDVVLGLIGVMATNVSKGAFTTRGYGTWPPITAETARRKGSGQTLIDTGILRSSITWVIRGG